MEIEAPDVDYYNQRWKQAREEASLYSQERDPALWQAFWNQYAPTYQRISRALRASNRMLVKSWQREGIINSSMEVLDIGCGPGTFTLPLAEIAGKVTGMDNSKGMLEMLAPEAEKNNINNIILENKDWKETEGNGKYDLVLAASCPAVNNLESLEKMNELAGKYCLYICPASRKSQDLRHLLWKEIMGERLQGKSFDISYPFNILYLLGYYPQLSFVQQEYSYREKAVTLVENYRQYFAIFGKQGPKIDEIIKRRVYRASPDGFYQENSSSKIAVMWWKVNERD